eukprot:CAMPEP_0115019146 /NCGR_PEP_ID=MMETSP0216-20121206/29253_1 /TAXON_ID=223996 /ORGANISM="Protocruzia adherens, Strain Boccale" /LENGTH=221 /DNA_ID=CAMNT_0002390527 /DNA_START=182 /DNA_END=847 /DNA_ORIENTATION=+
MRKRKVFKKLGLGDADERSGADSSLSVRSDMTPKNKKVGRKKAEGGMELENVGEEDEFNEEDHDEDENVGGTLIRDDDNDNDDDVNQSKVSIHFDDGRLPRFTRPRLSILHPGAKKPMVESKKVTLKLTKEISSQNIDERDDDLTEDLTAKSEHEYNEKETEGTNRNKEEDDLVVHKEPEPDQLRLVTIDPLSDDDGDSPKARSKVLRPKRKSAFIAKTTK